MHHTIKLSIVLIKLASEFSKDALKRRSMQKQCLKMEAKSFIFSKPRPFSHGKDSERIKGKRVLIETRKKAQQILIQICKIAKKFPLQTRKISKKFLSCPKSSLDSSGQILGVTKV